MRQIAGPLTGRLHLQSVLPQGAMLVQSFDEERIVAAYRRNQIVEIVGYASRQPADRRQPLHLLQLALQIDVLGHILSGSGDSGDLAGFIGQGFDSLAKAGLTALTAYGVVGNVGGPARGSNLANRLSAPAPILRTQRAGKVRL